MTSMSTSASKQRRLLATCAAALPAGFSLAAASQQAAWPTKPVRLVGGFARGGGIDVMARALAQPLGELLGQPVIVDNKPGAAGNLSADEVEGKTLSAPIEERKIVVE
jgi:tripartite-type tricarboxylate transporter receptor subunit TctC